MWVDWVEDLQANHLSLRPSSLSKSAVDCTSLEDTSSSPPCGTGMVAVVVWTRVNPVVLHVLSILTNWCPFLATLVAKQKQNDKIWFKHAILKLAGNVFVVGWVLWVFGGQSLPPTSRNNFHRT